MRTQQRYRWFQLYSGIHGYWTAGAHPLWVQFPAWPAAVSVRWLFLTPSVLPVPLLTVICCPSGSSSLTSVWAMWLCWPVEWEKPRHAPSETETWRTTVRFGHHSFSFLWQHHVPVGNHTCSSILERRWYRGKSRAAASPQGDVQYMWKTPRACWSLRGPGCLFCINS